jgi:hypothetical protein
MVTSSNMNMRRPLSLKGLNKCCDPAQASTRLSGAQGQLTPRGDFPSLCGTGSGSVFFMRFAARNSKLFHESEFPGGSLFCKKFASWTSLSEKSHTIAA